MKKDLVIIFSIFLLGIFLWVLQQSGSSPLYLIAEVNNKEVLRIDLRNIKTRKEFSVDGILGKSYFEYDPKKGVRMVSSPCPDKLCIKQGWINKIGESIVCLPNRVVLRLEGEK
ncbi:MAG: NusG domain II-containing protein [Dictyoglomaceae bacterium]